MLPAVLCISIYFWLVFYFLKIPPFYISSSHKGRISLKGILAHHNLRVWRTGVREQGAAVNTRGTWICGRDSVNNRDVSFSGDDCEICSLLQYKLLYYV